GDEVAERFAHLLLVDVDEPVVHPDAGEGPRVGLGGLALCDLVLVVGEDQVHPAAVHVEAVAQVARAHGRTFDVPARPPVTPGAVPTPGIGRLPLPQREVERVALDVPRVDPCAGDQLVDAPA